VKKIQCLAGCSLPRLIRHIMLLLAAFFSAPSWSQDEPELPSGIPETAVERPMISTGVEAEAIARKQPDAAVWLTDSDQNRVLALFQPELVTPARGALLILADEGVSSASGIADALRAPLSEAGWAVMTVGLPQPPFAVQNWLRQQDNRPMDSGEPAEAQGQGDAGAAAMITVMDAASPSEALRQYRELIVSALNAGVDALSEREYERIVLVGVGRGAGHVTRHSREDIRAKDLVWIAPHFYPDESAGLAKLLASATPLSILELYSTRPPEASVDRSARERAAALERAGISGYERQPVAMARQPKPRKAQALANRISAWLRSRAR
jgi:hypothetical protein